MSEKRVDNTRGFPPPSHHGRRRASLLLSFFLVVAYFALGISSVSANGHETKVLVCHLPTGNPAALHEIIVGSAAVAAHIAHGDYVGSCDDVDGGDDAQGGGEDILICHVPPGNDAAAHNITINSTAVDQHLAHGDHEGACDGTEGGGGDGGLVAICHVPSGNPAAFHNLTINASALDAHLAHGDHEGPCDGTEGGGGGDGGDGDGILICHIPPGNAAAFHNLTLNGSALEQHLDHGDHLGACDGTEGGEGGSGDGILICHVPPGNAAAFHNLTVNGSALEQHLDHGDHVGACDGTEGGGDTEITCAGVVAGRLKTLKVVWAANGSVVNDTSITTGVEYLFAAYGFTASGNLLGSFNATWSTTGTLDEVDAGPSCILSFTPTTAGSSGRIEASVNPTATSGLITVSGGGSAGPRGGGGPHGPLYITPGPPTSDPPGPTQPPGPPNVPPPFDGGQSPGDQNIVAGLSLSNLLWPLLAFAGVAFATIFGMNRGSAVRIHFQHAVTTPAAEAWIELFDPVEGDLLMTFPVMKVVEEMTSDEQVPTIEAPQPYWEGAFDVSRQGRFHALLRYVTPEARMEVIEIGSFELQGDELLFESEFAPQAPAAEQATGGLPPPGAAPAVVELETEVLAA